MSRESPQVVSCGTTLSRGRLPSWLTAFGSPTAWHCLLTAASWQLSKLRECASDVSGSQGRRLATWTPLSMSCQGAHVTHGSALDFGPESLVGFVDSRGKNQGKIDSSRGKCPNVERKEAALASSRFHLLIAHVVVFLAGKTYDTARAPTKDRIEMSHRSHKTLASQIPTLDIHFYCVTVASN